MQFQAFANDVTPVRGFHHFSGPESRFDRALARRTSVGSRHTPANEHGARADVSLTLGLEVDRRMGAGQSSLRNRAALSYSTACFCAAVSALQLRTTSIDRPIMPGHTI